MLHQNIYNLQRLNLYFLSLALMMDVLIHNTTFILIHSSWNNMFCNFTLYEFRDYEKYTYIPFKFHCCIVCCNFAEVLYTFHISVCFIITIEAILKNLNIPIVGLLHKLNSGMFAILLHPTCKVNDVNKQHNHIDMPLDYYHPQHFLISLVACQHGWNIADAA